MSNCQIFLGGLDTTAKPEDLERLLYELLLQCGTVKDIRIPRGDTGNVRGFAFAEMANEEAATYAVLALNGLRFCGKYLRVACAMDDEAKKQVKLSNLSNSLTEIDLYLALSEVVGLIRGISIARRDGRKEGNATIWMDSIEDAENAKRILSIEPLYIDSLSIKVI